MTDAREYRLVGRGFSRDVTDVGWPGALAPEASTSWAEVN
jgi:hypothetical protein